MQHYISVAQTKKKVVQTDLDLRDYEALSTVAKSRNLTLKEAAREALRWWSVSVADLSDVPLFKLRPVEFKVRVRADEIETFLYKRR